MTWRSRPWLGHPPRHPCLVKSNRGASPLHHTRNGVADHVSPSAPGRRAATRAALRRQEAAPVLEAAMGPARDGAEHVEIGEQASGAEASSRTASRAASSATRSTSKGSVSSSSRGGAGPGDVDLIEPADLMRGEPVRRDRLDEAHAVSPAGARQRRGISPPRARRADRPGRGAARGRAGRAPARGVARLSSRLRSNRCVCQGDSHGSNWRRATDDRQCTG